MITAAAAAPPVDLRAAGSAGLYTVVIAGMFVTVAAWCLRVGIRDRDPIPVLVLVSGLLAVGFEPVVDTLGHVWYARDNPLVVYTAVGVPQPVFLLVGYSFFWGGTVYAGYRALASGTGVWPMFAIVLALDLFVEVLGVRVLDVGVYYGDAPFRVLGFPLWWAPVNAAVTVVGARLLLHLASRLRGWDRLALLAVSPSAFAATHAICAWPTWVALGSDVPRAILWLAGAATVAMSLGLVRFVSATVGAAGRPAPPQRPASPAAPTRPRWGDSLHR